MLKKLSDESISWIVETQQEKVQDALKERTVESGLRVLFERDCEAVVTVRVPRKWLYWSFLAYKEWKGVRDKEEKLSMTCEEENAMLKLLLDHGGVLSHARAQKFFVGAYKLRIIGERLEEMGLVYRIRERNNQLWYVLNMEWMNNEMA